MESRRPSFKMVNTNRLPACSVPRGQRPPNAKMPMHGWIWPCLYSGVVPYGKRFLLTDVTNRRRSGLDRIWNPSSSRYLMYRPTRCRKRLVHWVFSVNETVDYPQDHHTISLFKYMKHQDNVALRNRIWKTAKRYMKGFMQQCRFKVLAWPTASSNHVSSHIIIPIL